MSCSVYDNQGGTWPDETLTVKATADDTTPMQWGVAVGVLRYAPKKDNNMTNVIPQPFHSSIVFQLKLRFLYNF